VTVPHDATSVTFDADPAVPSGLVFVGDVLSDDTLPRTVALAAGPAPTVLTLRSTAQDHTTTATYSIQIVRAEPAPELQVTAVAATRCVAGKVTLTVTATNASKVPVALSITTPFGTKQVAAVGPGKSSSNAFTTRAASIAGGAASVVATATVDGKDVAVTVPAAYAEKACG
jgi:uncharacterized protein